jgi:tRNA(fMet)-specific endonuclease VapC
VSLYLLDTNIVSDLIHRPQGKVTKAIARVGEDNIATSVIVACELRYGAAKKGSRGLAERVALVLSLIKICPFECPMDELYGEIRARLELSGNPVGANDLLIASQCLAMHATLVTANEREFSHIEGLQIENWLR